MLIIIYLCLPCCFTVEHALIVEDYPEDASLAPLAQLFPNAIFMTRLHQAAGSAGEKRW